MAAVAIGQAASSDTSSCNRACDQDVQVTEATMALRPM